MAKKAVSDGFDSVRLCKNRGGIRTALLYNSRRDATDAFAGVKDALADDAYLVSLDKWRRRGAGA